MIGVFNPLQRQPGSRVSEILFLNMISAVIFGETRNSLWNATTVRQRGHGKLSHHALDDRHESGAKSGASGSACCSRIVPTVLASALHVRVRPQTLARGGLL